MIHSRISLSGLALLFCFCSEKPVTVEHLRESFKKTEFVASRELGSDGWPEARRRQLFKAYLRGRKIPFMESQSPRDLSRTADKYRKISLKIRGKGAGGNLQVSLALWPGKSHLNESQFQAAQRDCDTGLFSVLDSLDSQLSRFSYLEFTVSESCIDLTTQLKAEN